LVGTGAGAAVALLLRRDLGSFWMGLLAFAVVTGVGAVLGLLVGRLLFRPSFGGPGRQEGDVLSWGSNL
jgi:hypothetical protein